MDDLDHRNLGVKLKLWHLQEDAPGMVFWHPRGYVIYRVLEDYVRRKMRRAGYAEVRTPQLLPQELWDRSGHWDKLVIQRRRSTSAVPSPCLARPRNAAKDDSSLAKNRHEISLVRRPSTTLRAQPAAGDSRGRRAIHLA